MYARLDESPVKRLGTRSSLWDASEYDAPYFTAYLQCLSFLGHVHLLGDSIPGKDMFTDLVGLSPVSPRVIRGSGRCHFTNTLTAELRAALCLFALRNHSPACWQYSRATWGGIASCEQVTIGTEGENYLLQRNRRAQLPSFRVAEDLASGPLAIGRVNQCDLGVGRTHEWHC